MKTKVGIRVFNKGCNIPLSLRWFGPPYSFLSCILSLYIIIVCTKMCWKCRYIAHTSRKVGQPELSTNAHTIPINLETWYGVIAAIWPKFALMHGHLFHSPIVSHLFSILFRYLISAQATKEDQFVPDVKNNSSTTTTTTTATVTGPEGAETRPKKHLVQTGEYFLKISIFNIF